MIRLVSDASRDAADLAAKSIARAWPDQRHEPSFDRSSLEAFDRELLAEATAGLARAAVVCVEGESRTALLKLVDRIRSAGWAALVLASSELADIQLCSGGVVVRSFDTPPGELASTLHALVSQHECVVELAREVEIAHKTSGGVREEMSRMSQELSLAQKIQQELIPRELPDTAGMELGVLFRPAGYVSGDIYNIAKIDERNMAFFIADAVGHGVPAALLTMIISRSLPMRGGVSEGRVITPADALGRLNDELCEVSDGNPRFATAVYGLIDTHSGLVRIANAGHPQPLRISADGVQRVEAGGPLLGVFQAAEFEEEVFELRTGETLLLYSDGFETAFPNTDAVLRVNSASPSRKYLDHLLHIGRWRQRGRRSVGDALDGLAQELDSARGSLHQPDDVTALALARLAKAA